MKKIVSVLAVCLLFINCSGQAIQVTTDKTISLIFPFAVTHVDRGSDHVLVQPVKEANNILLVKAGVVNFSPTNVSVVTSDGSVYALSLEYNPEPCQWVYQLLPQKNVSVSMQAVTLLDNRPDFHRPRVQSWDMELSLAGVYIKENVLYYQLRLENKSPIDYDIALLQCFIRDKKVSRRTAVQENILAPIYTGGNVTTVKAYSTNIFVIALEKFTIPDAKYFTIEVMEKNGGRHLALKIKNHHILSATILN